MSRENWIALPEASERTGGEIIVGDVGFPVGLDPEQLQLNADALRRGVIGWGGYQLLFLSAYSGEADTTSIGIGTDSGGNAYGIGTATRIKAESSRMTSFTEYQKNAENLRNGGLGIQWNKTALNSRIETHQKYDAKVQAKLINHEVRKAAIQGVVKHNVYDTLTNSDGSLRYFDIFSDLFTAAVVSYLGAINADPGYILGLATGKLAITASANAAIAFRRGAKYQDILNEPFYYSVRPTRAAIATGVLASKKLIRATPIPGSH